MAFRKIGSLSSDDSPVLRKKIIANSITISEGDSVNASSGFVSLGTTGALVLGHVVGIITDSGVGVSNNGASGDFTNTYTTASDNQTSAKVSVLLNVSKKSLYSVTPDATIGTTTGSNLLGYHTDIKNENSTDESTAVTTTAQYFIWGVDPANSGNQVVNIYESLVFGV